MVLTHDADFLRMVSEKRIKHCGIIFVSQNKLSVGDTIRKIEFLAGVISASDMLNHIEFL